MKNDALAAHHQTCTCEIPWYCMVLRKVRESLEIRRLKRGLGEPKGVNQDMGDYVTTSSWNDIFDKIKEEIKLLCHNHLT